MTGLEIAKTVTKFLVKGGVAAATANIVANARNHSDNSVIDTYQKTAGAVGGFAAGWMLGDAVADFADAKFDETVAAFQNWNSNQK